MDSSDFGERLRKLEEDQNALMRRMEALDNAKGGFKTGDRVENIRASIGFPICIGLLMILMIVSLRWSAINLSVSRGDQYVSRISDYGR